MTSGDTKKKGITIKGVGGTRHSKIMRRRKIDSAQRKVGIGLQEERKYWGEIERQGERARKREMEGDCASDKSGPIEISAGTGAQCYRQEARKMAKTGKARAGILH